MNGEIHSLTFPLKEWGPRLHHAKNAAMDSGFCETNFRQGTTGLHHARNAAAGLDFCETNFRQGTTGLHHVSNAVMGSFVF